MAGSCLCEVELGDGWTRNKVAKEKLAGMVLEAGIIEWSIRR